MVSPPSFCLTRNCGLARPRAQGRVGKGASGPAEQGPQPVAIFCAQEKSHIEVYVRPLANEASAIVFFSRRTDMPYHYRTSLARLNFSSSKVYEVSALLPAALWVSLRVLLGPHAHRGPFTHTPSPKPWALGPLAGAVLCTGVFKLHKRTTVCK